MSPPLPLAGVYAYGVFTYFGSLTLTQVTASASGASNANYGMLHSTYDSPVMMTGCSFTASGGQSSYGVDIEGGSATIRQCIIRAGTASSNSWGLVIGNTDSEWIVRVDHSLVEGNHASIKAYSGYTINVGASQLIGSVLKYFGTTFNCFGNYDANYDAINCP